MTDEIGFALSAAFIAWRLYRLRAAKSKGALTPAPAE
jgi:hypothetical protein